MIPYQPSRQPRAAARFRHGPLPVMGLTGGIGSGKSEVASLLKAHGAVVIDADAVGHELLNDPLVRGQITERFGEGVVSGKGTMPVLPAIDRRALGAIVFGDPQARHDLESILHPRMSTCFKAVIDDAEQAGDEQGSLIVLDAAILLEAGWDKLCDLIVFVDAPRDERIGRVEQKRGWTRAAFDAREQAQWPTAKKRAGADFMITNDASIDCLRHEVRRLFDRVAELSSPIFEASNP
jgi:dephospho-CoA kinase